MALVLAGDIGGTQTRLALAEVSADRCQTLLRQTYASTAYPDLAPILADFRPRIAEVATAPLVAACLGVAGPIRHHATGQVAQITNLPWRLDSQQLGQMIGSPTQLINDFEAVGYGIGTLQPEDCTVLQAGQPEMHGTRAVLGAGTGLGVALLVWRESAYHVLASEGGHADFAPFDALTQRLWHYLHPQLGRVSIEQVLSGPGLTRLFTFLQTDTAQAPTPALQTALAHSGDTAAALSQFGLAQTDTLAVASLQLFARIYAAVAGNLALTAKASGGVYLAGGIAAKILPVLQTEDFLHTFAAKAPMTALLHQMPVTVIRNPDVGLQGAAWVAGRACPSGTL